jgi:hypothetical protein
MKNKAIKQTKKSTLFEAQNDGKGFREPKTNQILLKLSGKLEKVLNHHAKLKNIARTRLFEDIVKNSILEFIAKNPIQKTKTITLTAEEYDIIVNHRKSGDIKQKTLF